MGQILVGLDGSDTSRNAFHEAIREARWRNATVLATHVVGDPLLSGYAYTFPDSDKLRANGERFLAEELDQLEQEYESGFPIGVETATRIGHPGVQLIEVAQGDSDGPVDLVVLGSRGYGGFRGLLVGSVTTYAVHHLRCPLLVVPAQVDADV